MMTLNVCLICIYAKQIRYRFGNSNKQTSNLSGLKQQQLISHAGCMLIAGHQEVLIIGVIHGAVFIANIASHHAKQKNRALECLAVKYFSLEVTHCHCNL